ncbi:MAG: alpha-L-arabinofuranosidase C-terminal domain-containing protein, partial [Phyllobacterium sp.]
DEGVLTLFVVNRHLTEKAELDVSLTGFAEAALFEHHAMEGYGLNDTNGPDRPDHVVPKQGAGVGVEDGNLKGSIAPLSYHVFRLKTN